MSETMPPMAREILEVLKKAPHGMSKDGVRAYLENEREIRMLEALNDLLLQGKMDAEWDEETREFKYTERTLEEK